MATASLEPCWVKVSRAQAHFDAVNAEIGSFLNTRPYSVSLQNDPKTNDVIVEADALQEPPSSWSVLIGDCVHNLRTALDYLVTQLVKAEGGTPGNRHEFPIAFDPGYYSEHVPRKLAGLSKGTVDLIETLQPYTGRNDWRQDLLVLHDLDRYDKHRFLQVTAYVLGFWRIITAASNGVATPSYTVPPLGGRFEPGQEIGRVTFESSDPNAKLEVRVERSFDIAFDETEAAAPGRVVLPTLVACFNATRRVLRTFA